MPLPVTAAADWYSTGGRYWAQVWTVCGWRKAGDKFIGDKSIAWAEPMPPREAELFWQEIGNLARASDAWQVAQGIDASTPTPQVDVAALTNRSRDWRHFFELHPIWNQPSAARSTALVAFLKEAWKQLQEWYRKRYPGRPPLPPALPSVGGGAIWLVFLLGIAASGRRKTPPRRRR